MYALTIGHMQTEKPNKLCCQNDYYSSFSTKNEQGSTFSLVV